MVKEIVKDPDVLTNKYQHDFFFGRDEHILQDLLVKTYLKAYLQKN